MTAGYEPRFDIDYGRGLTGERRVEAIREAIVRDRIEVKTDHRLLDTGNVYVEFQQKSRAGKWIPSGIAIDEPAELWAFASPSETSALVFPTRLVKEVARAVWGSSAMRTAPPRCPADPTSAYHAWLHMHAVVGCCPSESSETRPTHGIKVPLDRLLEFAWRVPIVSDKAEAA